MNKSLTSGVIAEDSGQTIIELAIGVSAFLLMVFGFIQFCLVVFGMGNANFASRAALRYAELHSNSSYKPTTQADLNNIVSAFIIPYPSNTWSVSSNYIGGNSVSNGQISGNYVTDGVYIVVTVTYTIHVMGHTFNNLTYSTSGATVVAQ